MPLWRGRVSISDADMQAHACSFQDGRSMPVVWIAREWTEIPQSS